MRVWIAAVLPVALAALGPGLAGQDLEATIARLRSDRERARALVDLNLMGPKATVALAQAVRTALAAADPDVLALAQALAELPGTQGAIPALVDAVPRAAPAVRDPLLHALGTCVLAADDAEVRGEVEGSLTEWAKAGLCYSPDAATATFAWYEFVRVRRCLAVRTVGTDVPGLLTYLAHVRQQRQMIAGFGGNTPADQICNLGRFGQHGTREEIEAIADLALALGPDAREVAVVLAEYLGHEPPRPGEVIVEHCAGIGEEAPVDTPAVRFPTRWHRDAWRFASARVIFALHPDAERREHALRHLLHAPSSLQRLDALAAVRAWPESWVAFAPELAACLQDGERDVVREALVTLGLADAATVAGVSGTALQDLAGGKDRELAALARRARRAR